MLRATARPSARLRRGSSQHKRVNVLALMVTVQQDVEPCRSACYYPVLSAGIQRPMPNLFYLCSILLSMLTLVASPQMIEATTAWWPLKYVL